MRTIARWRQHPSQFVTDLFGVKPEPFQSEALEALAHYGRVSMRSGHGVGKTTTLAWAIIWYINTHYPCKIPCTAPSAPQLNDVLWAELALWYRRLPEGIRDQFELKADRFELKSAPKESFAVARTASKHTPEALQGFHSDNLLFVMDEASGIPDIVFEVASGALSTPNAKQFMAANPTRTSGYFYDSHHKNREKWQTIRVPCSASSRVSPNYAQDIADSYGKDGNIYRVRVLGEFPTSEDDVVIPLEWCEEAKVRDIDPVASASVVWGLDVARFGDDSSALCKRKGNVMIGKSMTWRGKDTMQLAGIIANEYHSTWSPNKPEAINVDLIGIGAGVVDRLRELGLPVKGINVAESPAIGDRYNRLRDELWWKARDWFKDRDVKLLDDDHLIGELTSIKYGFTSAGKIKVESKEEMKKRGLRSPDRADAWCLTFAGNAYRRVSKPLKYPRLRLV